jgi:hypothetical protein
MQNFRIMYRPFCRGNPSLMRSTRPLSLFAFDGARQISTKRYHAGKYTMNEYDDLGMEALIVHINH